ncbi:Putative NAD-dependent epimerase/dehydratase [Corynebacterium glyciniphilum AJ 3170]|uniref:Putative NAD-dependent epimerase/dehydratase n=1 Tax=Corynebacterium glyciniphilum AJ 3170 TaxID=1404245 RepID=X5DUW1_9CORY|nr:NAD(P)H-binding protein [Corynebacterium glyciniphilum]AHW64437.1 Putative NAD-dependent epimerase/dehydratase [Corynebacterium glyciniphilum AJ 3170]
MTDVLIIGGHGKVGLLATPKLVDHGFSVTSLIRNPDQVTEIESLGATALLKDVTQVTASDWDGILAGFDVIVWTAGNGGRGGPEVTYAVDRDAALAVIDSLERLRDSGTTPRYLNVSYAGARDHTVPETDSFFPYADSKKTVDDRLVATEGLDYVILGPATLTEDPAEGVAPVTADLDRSDAHTARELVADVIVEFAGREDLPGQRTVEFVDGTAPVSEL